mgnify:CR=1 FL=1
MTEEKKLTLGSLFDGSGGFPLGAILVGIEPKWASEVEPFPIRVTTKRLPMVKHYGDINQIHGGKVEPVDIITFGSPCIDMSIAGKRAGLDGKQSCLFYEAVRVIKEMREATNGRYPRLIVWENVTGAFSSSGGRDFQSVLTEIVRIKEPQAPTVPMPEKTGWPYADILMGDGWSLAYRVMDAQGWGVPQRRRRIYLVADFTGSCASKILFDTESLLGDSASCFSSWQGFAGKLAYSLGTAGKGVSAGFCTEHSAKSRSIGYEEEKSPTLRAGVVPAAITTQQAQVYENHSMDSRYTGSLDVAPTVASTYGTGGNNQPLVTKFWDGRDVAGTITASNAAGQQRMPDKDNFNAVVSTIDIRLTSEGTKNARHNIHETNIARCIDTSGNTPDANQGGVAIVQQDAAYAMTTGCYTQVEKEKSPTLMSRDYKDPTAVKQGYIVRRLTPLECCRLQGFPDWWCSDLGTEDPTEEEIQFWREVFENHRRAMGTAKKPKTDKQIRKWLANPHTDSAEYKMWGNGVAEPCVYYVLLGIAHFAQET